MFNGTWVSLCSLIQLFPDWYQLLFDLNWNWYVLRELGLLCQMQEIDNKHQQICVFHIPCHKENNPMNENKLINIVVFRMNVCSDSMIEWNTINHEQNTIHILAVFGCFSLVMNDGRTRDDCEYFDWKEIDGNEESVRTWFKTTQRTNIHLCSFQLKLCVCKHHLLRFVVVLLICFEWVGRKRRNKHLLLTIVQDWWKLVFLVNQLSVSE